MVKTVSIQVVNASEINSVSDFKKYASFPTVIKGLQLLQRDLSISDLAAALDVVVCQVIETQTYVKIKVDDILKDLNSEKPKYHLTDGAIRGTALENSFMTPSFLQTDWMKFHSDEYEKSVLLSKKGTFTPWHTDTGGISGWYYYIYGKKDWTFIHRDCFLMMYDPLFMEIYNDRNPSHVTDKEKGTRFNLVDSVSVQYHYTAVSGDYIWIPPGWLHRVETVEDTFGFGGGHLIPETFINSLQFWLLEKTFYGIPEGFVNLEDIVKNHLMPMIDKLPQDQQKVVYEALEILNQFNNRKNPNDMVINAYK